MLVNLHVKNMALIEEADIELGRGLTILTGETGAGKSIIIGSINAALGGKVSSDVIRKGAEYALVELTFELDDSTLGRLKEFDISDAGDNTLLITRRIMPSRSVIKVNGETVTAAQIKKIASLLIDIHGQHEHQSLLLEEKHLELIDRFFDAKALAVKEAVAKEYAHYVSLRHKCADFNMDEEQRRKEIAFIRFETDEINNAGLVAGEDAELEQSFSRMNNSQKIVHEAAAVHEMICESSQETAGSLIGKSLRSLSQITRYDSKLEEFYEELSQIDSLINDFGHELSSYITGLEFDDEEFALTEKRLDLINSLKMKYGSSIEAILAYRDEKINKLSEFENYEERKNELNLELSECIQNMNELCEKLYSFRKKAADFLTKSITQSLKELNFLDVRFEVAFSKTDAFTANGNDCACFMIATNPGEDLKPLSKIASGGEMSRIMLAIKAALADKDDMDSLIFDEIDTGISGRTAQMVARKMYSIADTHQILCITHLPQIASMSDHHFLIEKNVVDDKTITSIRKLDDEESINELARLLGGSTITDTVLANAREMKATAHN